jgi:hypothetical protein
MKSSENRKFLGNCFILTKGTYSTSTPPQVKRKWNLDIKVRVVNGDSTWWISIAFGSCLLELRFQRSSWFRHFRKGYVYELRIRYELT